MKFFHNLLRGSRRKDLLRIRGLFASAILLSSFFSLHAQPSDNQFDGIPFDDISNPKSVDPESFQQENFEMDLPGTSYDLQEGFGRAQSGTEDMVESYQRIAKFLGKNAPIQLHELSPEAYTEFVTQLENFRLHWESEEKQRRLANDRGILSSRVPNEAQFLIFDEILKQPAEAMRASLNLALQRSQRAPLSEEEAQEVLRLSREVVELGVRLIQNPPKELLKYLKYRDATDRLRFLADRNRIQLPLRPNGMPYEQKSDLEGKARAEITWAGEAPIIRVILPNRAERIVIRDDRFTSRLDPFYQLFIARQLVRAGNGTGTDVLTLAYLQNQNSGRGPFVSEFTVRPPNLSFQRMSTFKVAAFPPISQDAMTFAVFYVFAMSGLGFFNEYLVAEGMPKIDSTLITEGLYSLFNPNTAKETWGAVFGFYRDHIKPLQSHIVLSTLIGLFHPTYRFLIYHGPQWWQSLKHFGIISFPAGAWTEFITRGPSTSGAIHVAENSLFNNTVRPHLYAAPTERSLYRLNTWKLKFWPRWKWQQFETELIGFLPSFFAKYAALRDLTINDAPVGRYAFGILLPVAFLSTYAYFRYSKDADFSDARRKIVEGFWSPFSLGVMTFYYWRMFELDHMTILGAGQFGEHFGYWMNYLLPTAIGVLRGGAIYGAKIEAGKIQKPSLILKAFALPGHLTSKVCKSVLVSLRQPYSSKNFSTDFQDFLP